MNRMISKGNLYTEVIIYMLTFVCMFVCCTISLLFLSFSVLYNAALNRESHAKSFFPNNFNWTRTVTTDTF